MVVIAFSAKYRISTHQRAALMRHQNVVIPSDKSIMEKCCVAECQIFHGRRRNFVF
jgi:hypothetical protein